MGHLLAKLNPWQSQTEPNFTQSKPDMEIWKDFIVDQATILAPKVDFERCSTEMFIDGVFHAGRLEMWYCLAHAVWQLIPDSKCIVMDSVVKRWFKILQAKVPEQMNRIEEMQAEWDNMKWD